jgi:hypothetical protein
VQTRVVELVLVGNSHRGSQAWIFRSFHKEVLRPGTPGSVSGLLLEGRMLHGIKDALSG